MKFGLTLKIAAITFVIATIGVLFITYVTYSSVDSHLQNQAMKHLTNDLHTEAIRLKSVYQNTQQDATFLANSAPVLGIMRASLGGGYDREQKTSLNLWKKRLASQFKIIIQQRPELLQLRLIGVDDNGLEIIRVERTSKGIVIIKDVDFQHKGQGSYFKEAVILKPNQIYFSEITFNRELGKISYPLQPVLHVSTPVYTKRGDVFGIIVINTDFKRLIKTFLTPSPDRQFFLTNSKGDYLFHSEGDEQLAFELAGRNRVQNDFPVNEFFYSSSKKNELVLNISENKLGLALQKFRFDPLNQNRAIVLGTTATYSLLGAQSAAFRNNIIVILALVVAIITCLTALSTRIIMRPIKNLTNMANRIASGEEGLVMPHMGQDEVGVLSSSMNTMLATLNRSRDELKTLTNSLEVQIEERTKDLALSNYAIEASQNGIVITDTRKRIIYANPAFLQMWGYGTNQELWNINIETLWKNENESKDAASRLEKNGSWSGDFVGRKKNNDDIHIHMLVSKIKKAQALTGFVFSCQDILLRKLTEDALKEAKEAAEAANRAKSIFLANMSHEIRTPMNAIIGMAELLDDTPLNNEQKEYVDVFRRAGGTLINLINDILDLSKIESGLLELNEYEFDLEDTVAGVFDICSVAAHKKGLEVAYHIDPDVQTHFTGDENRLRQVLVNLIGNAVKFTHTGEVILKVSRAYDAIETREGQVKLQFTVIDTGIGIPEEKLDSIFQEFSQVDATTTRDFGGTGLGLAISKRIIEKMDGNIGVDSTPGVGSVFHFTVHMKAASSVATIDTDNALPDEFLKTLENKSAIIVDTNETGRNFLTTTLEDWAMRVTTASSGKEAHELIKKRVDAGEPHDIILLNNSLPDITGLSLASSIKNDFGLEQTIILLLSSNANSADRIAVSGLGCSGFLTKPPRQTRLLQSIIMALNSKEDTEEKLPELKEEEEKIARDDTRELKVLLVEDSLDNVLLIKAYLKKLPYEIVVAENGEKAVERFKNSRYDIVLMDMEMPVMDGYDATEKIRAWEEQQGIGKTPISALTAYALKEDTDKCIKAGCDLHLSKPLKKQVLKDVIKRYT